MHDRVVLWYNLGHSRSFVAFGPSLENKEWIQDNVDPFLCLLRSLA